VKSLAGWCCLALFPLSPLLLRRSSTKKLRRKPEHD